MRFRVLQDVRKTREQSDTVLKVSVMEYLSGAAIEVVNNGPLQARTNHRR